MCMYRATDFCRLYIFSRGAPVLHAILTGCRLMILLRCLLMVSGSDGMGTRSWGWQGRVEPPSRHHGGSGPRHHHAWNRGFSEAAKYGCLWTINRQTRSWFGCHHPRKNAVVAGSNIAKHHYVWPPGPAPCYRCLHYHADCGHQQYAHSHHISLLQSTLNCRYLCT